MHNYTLLSRREVLYGAGLLAASVLIHGALIASVGLALGVWVARQGRAIAMSVGFAVLIAAGWPFLVSAAGPGPVAGGLAALSPLVAFLVLSDVLLTRVVSFRENLWWVTFLDLECLALAVGVLWLTVRSFDAASGRIPERPRRVPMLSDEVVVLAAMLGVGGLFGAVACTLREHRSFAYQTDIGIVATVLAVAVGIHLVAALAAGWVPPGAEADAGPGHRAFAIRWWRSFRLVPALAVGPALLVTAMAAAPLPVRVVTTITPKAGGGSTRIATQATGVTYVIETRGDGKPSLIREATAAEIAAVPHWPRGRDLAGSLPVAGAAVLTILVHGAAFVAIGAAMGIGMRRRGRAIAATVGLALLVEVAWPIAFARLGYHPGGSPDPALASAIPACVLLMFRLNRADAVEDMTGWVAYWDGMLILVGVVAAGLAVRALGRRSDAPGRAVSGIMGGAVPHLERSPRSPGGPDPWST